MVNIFCVAGVTAGGGGHDTSPSTQLLIIAIYIICNAKKKADKLSDFKEVTILPCMWGYLMEFFKKRNCKRLEFPGPLGSARTTAKEMRQKTN